LGDTDALEKGFPDMLPRHNSLKQASKRAVRLSEPVSVEKI